MFKGLRNSNIKSLLQKMVLDKKYVQQFNSKYKNYITSALYLWTGILKPI